MVDDQDQVAEAVVLRIAAHVRELRTRYPDALAQLRMMAGKRGLDGLPHWPEWCWLPMAGSAAVVTRYGGAPVDFGRVAAIAQWWLTGQDIVLPSLTVAEQAIPHLIDPDAPLDEQLASMDLRIPRDELLDELAGACYYVASPSITPPAGAPVWVYGCYVHLEWDTHTGRPELRLLVDLGGGWDDLSPVPVHLDQPTLGWSATSVQQVIMSHLHLAPGAPEAHTLAQYARTLAWAVWPLVGALLDRRAHLVGPHRVTTTPAPGSEQERLLRLVPRAQVWQLTYSRPSGGHLRPVK